MKTFVLALALLAPDGTKTELPIELWRFDSMADCVKSSAYLNKAATARAKNYTCIEHDPTRAVARAAPTQPASRRNS